MKTYVVQLEQDMSKYFVVGADNFEDLIQKLDLSIKYSDYKYIENYGCIEFNDERGFPFYTIYVKEVDFTSGILRITPFMFGKEAY